MVEDILAEYIRKNPRDVPKLGILIMQVEEGDKLNDRNNFRGHITGSGIVLNRDRTKILLIYHKQFQKWQQPGGHWEGKESSPLIAAAREVAEETGVTELSYVPIDSKQPLVPFAIDSHLVTARPHKQEPEHWHHDFRYVFIAKSQALQHQASEVEAAQWFDFTAPECERVESIITKLRDTKIIQ